jgi:hypothetical protein
VVRRKNLDSCVLRASVSITRVRGTGGRRWSRSVEAFGRSAFTQTLTPVRILCKKILSVLRSRACLRNSLVGWGNASRRVLQQYRPWIALGRVAKVVQPLNHLIEVASPLVTPALAKI